jgi:hypothetical protein
MRSVVLRSYASAHIAPCYKLILHYQFCKRDLGVCFDVCLFVGVCFVPLLADCFCVAFGLLTNH